MPKQTEIEALIGQIDDYCGDLSVSKQESKARYDEIWEHCESASAALEDEIALEEEEDGFEGEDGG